MKGIFSLIIIVVLLVLAFAVGSQNEAVITVNYLIAQAELRVSTLIAIAVTIGVIIGFLMMLTSWLALRIQLTTTRSRLKKALKDH
ncbi:LapA family protein [Salinimonas sediminis]|uniref:Probable lipopolysaccharide assembly protein A n=1 Tax=Salinimonas sediminis TaxID=2303538 RepID=A0A346NMM6_9ALTE|nr:LapA family protein [Salinimonas sediminis]AXR06783.1 LapA family protein [Salinimonas sediminis]